MQATSKAVLLAAAILAAVLAGRAGLHANTPLVPGRGVPELRQDLPDGPGKDVVVRLCDGCHDLIFTVSTRENEEGWTRIVNDMRSRGTDGTEEEFVQVIAYLTTHMGKAEAEGHADVELVANRTKVAPGERFALGLRLVAAAGWRLKDGVDGSGRSSQVSWTMPEAVSVGDPARPAGDEPASLLTFPAVVSTSARPGSTLRLSVRVTYAVCRETCVTETATTSMTLPIGDGGQPSREREFAGTSSPR
jgi:hypothetical protein